MKRYRDMRYEEQQDLLNNICWVIFGTLLFVGFFIWLAINF